MLLESHADIHAKDHFDQTAFIAAVTGGHVNTAEILLKNGANPSAPNGEDMLPIFIAFEREDFENGRFIIKIWNQNQHYRQKRKDSSSENY